jgi:hypothetical protein
MDWAGLAFWVSLCVALAYFIDFILGSRRNRKIKRRLLNINLLIRDRKYRLIGLWVMERVSLMLGLILAPDREDAILTKHGLMRACALSLTCNFIYFMVEFTPSLLRPFFAPQLRMWFVILLTASALAILLFGLAADLCALILARYLSLIAIARRHTAGVLVLDAAFAALFFLCALILMRAVIFASFSTGQAVMIREFDSCESRAGIVEFDPSHPLRSLLNPPLPPATSSEKAMGICDWHYLMPWRIAGLFLSAGKTGLEAEIKAVFTQSPGRLSDQLTPGSDRYRLLDSIGEYIDILRAEKAFPQIHNSHEMYEQLSRLGDDIEAYFAGQETLYSISILMASTALFPTAIMILGVLLALSAIVFLRVTAPLIRLLVWRVGRHEKGVFYLFAGLLTSIVVLVKALHGA